jgi:hypothetical protein
VVVDGVSRRWIAVRRADFGVGERRVALTIEENCDLVVGWFAEAD